MVADGDLIRWFASSLRDVDVVATRRQEARTAYENSQDVEGDNTAVWRGTCRRGAVGARASGRGVTGFEFVPFTLQLVMAYAKLLVVSGDGTSIKKGISLLQGAMPAPRRATPRRAVALL